MATANTRPSEAHNANSGRELESEGIVAEDGSCGEKGLGLYWLLLSVETGGTAVLFSNLLPLYRVMAFDFGNYRPDPAAWWAIIGIVLTQVPYWLGRRLQPRLPRLKSTILSHILAFVAKLSFVAVTASFSVMFLNRAEALKQMNYPPLRVLVVLVMFFALFCWTLELERLSKALQRDKHETATHRD